MEGGRETDAKENGYRWRKEVNKGERALSTWLSVMS